MNILLKPEALKTTEKHLKTNIYSLSFLLEITRENAVRSAVLTEIFNNCCRLYTNPADMNKRLYSMGGAVFNADTVKKGGCLCMSVTLEALKSVSDTEAAGFIDDVVFNPLVSDGGFDYAVFKRAKDTVRERINTRRDSKRSYAVTRSLEEMFGGLGFGIPDDGYREDLEEVNNINLFEFYTENIQKAEPIEKGVYGKIPDFESYLTNDVKDIDEKASAEQGRLCIGLTTDYKNKAATEVLNEILGGGAVSKLFNTVREKESLCYYVNSAYYKLNGVILIQAGIKPSAKDKTVELILKAVKGLKDDITDEDIKTAKASVINRIMMKEDNPYGILDNYIDGIIIGKREGLRNKIAILNGITAGDIAKAAEKLTLNTKYFLM